MEGENIKYIEVAKNISLPGEKYLNLGIESYIKFKKELLLKK